MIDIDIFCFVFKDNLHLTFMSSCSWAFPFYMHRKGLIFITMSYSNSDIATISQKSICWSLLVWKSSNFNFMPSYLKWINFCLKNIWLTRTLIQRNGLGVFRKFNSHKMIKICQKRLTKWGQKRRIKSHSQNALLIL